jgi:hypothetical protein
MANKVNFMNDQNLDLLITISPDEFERIKTDPDFVTLMTLARVTNTINFCISVMKSANEQSKLSDTPAGSRQLLNAFLFSAGALYEGMIIVQSLGREFRSLDSFINGFQQLWADRNIQQLRQGALNHTRNQVAFHFWRDSVIGDTLRNINTEPTSEAITFAAAKSSNPAKAGVAPNDIYYTFADEVVVNFLVGQPAAGQSSEDKLLADWQRITDLLNRFLDCANDLIEEVVTLKGWNVVRSW